MCQLEVVETMTHGTGIFRQNLNLGDAEYLVRLLTSQVWKFKVVGSLTTLIAYLEKVMLASALVSGNLRCQRNYIKKALLSVSVAELYLNQPSG